jgi:iron-sulfur cluster assembly accessory protein
MTATGTTTTFTITDAALAKIREAMSQQQLASDENNLRVFVDGGGGCCGGGPQFGLAFDKAQDGDARFEHGGMNVVIDPMSLPFVAGATIDFVDTPEVQGFKVSAPAMQKMAQGGCSSGGCGCGANESGGGGGGCGSGGGGCGSGGGHSHEHGGAEHSHGGGHAHGGHSHGGGGGGCCSGG